MDKWYVGEYVIYRDNEKYELGRIASLREDGAFVCYHDGETAAKTPYDHMHKIINAYAIKDTSLGGERFEVELLIVNNRQWVDFLAEQFSISRASAKNMLHGMLKWKQWDNFKRG